MNASACAFNLRKENVLLWVARKKPKKKNRWIK